ncbi:hypothetical protein Bca101_058563 [Brassica carinata]
MFYYNLRFAMSSISPSTSATSMVYPYLVFEMQQLVTGVSSVYDYEMILHYRTSLWEDQKGFSSEFLFNDKFYSKDCYYYVQYMKNLTCFNDI